MTLSMSMPLRVRCIIAREEACLLESVCGDTAFERRHFVSLFR